MEDYKVGNIVKGEVTGIEPYGFFVKIDNKDYGLVHISEITNKFVKDINKFVKVGELIYAKIVAIDTNKKNLRLSIKGLNYKVNNENQKVKESIRGFSPLQENLSKWTEETLKNFEK